jgi:hypothetical protein
MNFVGVSRLSKGRITKWLAELLFYLALFSGGWPAASPRRRFG